nr:ribosome maturation factor RimP [Candidatus Ichthyocystis hellenicum]
MCYNRQRALAGFFLFSVLIMDDFLPWLEKTLAGLGYDLVDFEVLSKGLIRVFIDHPNGVTVDDCARVSRHFCRAFTVKGIDYEHLEVSSPGADRILKKAADFNRFINYDVKVTASQPIVVGDHVLPKTVVGRLLGFDSGQNEITLLVDDCVVAFSLEKTKRVRLVPNF